MYELMIGSEELTSLKVAELTGKHHDHVRRDMKDEYSKVFGNQALTQLLDNQATPKMELSDTQPVIAVFDKQGRVRYFEITKDWWLQIGARYDAKVRYTMIQYIRKLESKQALPQTYSQALMELAKTVEAKEIAEAQLIVAKPKVAVYDKIVETDNSVTLGEFAKMIKIKDINGKSLGRNTLVKYMRSVKLFMGGSTKPYQIYIDSGWFSVHTNDLGIVYTRVHPKAYGRIINKLSKFISDKIELNNIIADGN